MCRVDWTYNSSFNNSRRWARLEIIQHVSMIMAKLAAMHVGIPPIPIPINSVDPTKQWRFNFSVLVSSIAHYMSSIVAFLETDRLAREPVELRRVLDSVQECLSDVSARLVFNIQITRD